MKKITRRFGMGAVAAGAVLGGYACSVANSREAGSLTGGDAASKVYVAPGQHDEFYAFMSGGFNGQVSVYGLPSGRMLKLIPVFSQHAENGWGYNEETKPMLETSHGFVPWDDSHHPELPMTDGSPDGEGEAADGTVDAVTRYTLDDAGNLRSIERVDGRTDAVLERSEYGYGCWLE